MNTQVHDNTITGVSVIYNSYQFNTSPSKVLGIDAFDTAKVILNKYKLSRADGEIITNKQFGEKFITIEGRTTGTSYDNLQSNLDTLKSKLVEYGKNLDIIVNGNTRRYLAAVSSSSFDIHQECACVWKITFACTAIGTDTSTTSLTFGTYTATSTAYANTITGSYKAEPTINLTVNYANPYWTSKYINIENSVTNQRIRLTRTWNPYDSVVIDGINKTVTVYPTTKTIVDTMDSITAWTSGHTLTLNTTTMLEGAGCSSVAMAAAATTSYVERANFATVVDFSATAGKVWIPVFIPTPTSGTVGKCRLSIGSDATLSTNASYWEVTTQWDGSAIATNAWNYFVIDLSSSPTTIAGTVNRSLVKTIRVSLTNASNFQLNGWRLDYLTIMKVSVTGQVADFEGTFPDLQLGSATLTVTDELTARNITISGNYTKRYL